MTRRSMATPTRIDRSAKVAYNATQSNAPVAQGAPSGTPSASLPTAGAAANSFNSQQSGMAKVIPSK